MRVLRISRRGIARGGRSRAPRQACGIMAASTSNNTPIPKPLRVPGMPSLSGSMAQWPFALHCDKKLRVVCRTTRNVSGERCGDTGGSYSITYLPRSWTWCKGSPCAQRCCRTYSTHKPVSSKKTPAGPPHLHTNTPYPGPSKEPWAPRLASISASAPSESGV